LGTHILASGALIHPLCANFLARDGAVLDTDGTIGALLLTLNARSALNAFGANLLALGLSLGLSLCALRRTLGARGAFDTFCADLLTLGPLTRPFDALGATINPLYTTIGFLSRAVGARVVTVALRSSGSTDRDQRDTRRQKYLGHH